MDTITNKVELEGTLGSALMGERTGEIKVEGDLGKFTCQSSRHDGFFYNFRKYETGNESLTIPIASTTPVVTMIFQFNGKSLYRDKYDPFTLPYQHHSLNFFNRFECRSLVRGKTSLHDITFVLNKNFFDGILRDSTLPATHLTENILRGNEFNTISSGLPMDASMRDVVHTIVTCPFADGFREAYVTAQLRALFILQFCQFHHQVTDKPMQVDNRITSRDRDILHDIRNFLDEFYMDDTSLEKLTRTFGINEFKLKHGFRTLFNDSPIRYILERRMLLASDLLRNTDKSVNEISKTIGFQHPNNFSLAFRKRYGVTPKEYRG